MQDEPIGNKSTEHRSVTKAGGMGCTCSVILSDIRNRKVVHPSIERTNRRVREPSNLVVAKGLYILRRSCVWPSGRKLALPRPLLIRRRLLSLGLGAIEIELRDDDGFLDDGITYTGGAGICSVSPVESPSDFGRSGVRGASRSNQKAKLLLLRMKSGGRGRPLLTPSMRCHH
ncbi:hypothetical protein FRB93_005394 [Tulasnella sp. JGI-2019a]|nr:hypothetical protein FRB93_005394 [Tulasnella sp. JGI-2019a]